MPETQDAIKQRQIRQRIYNIQQRGFKTKTTRPRTFQPGFIYIAKTNPVVGGEVFIGSTFSDPIVPPYERVEALALIDSDQTKYARLLLCHVSDGQLSILKDEHGHYLYVFAAAQDFAAGKFTQLSGQTALNLVPQVPPLDGVDAIEPWAVPKSLITVLSTSDLLSGDTTEASRRTAARLDAARNSTKIPDIEKAARILAAKVGWVQSHTKTKAAPKN